MKYLSQTEVRDEELGWVAGRPNWVGTSNMPTPTLDMSEQQGQPKRKSQIEVCTCCANFFGRIEYLDQTAITHRCDTGHLGLAG